MRDTKGKVVAVNGNMIGVRFEGMNAQLMLKLQYI